MSRSRQLKLVAKFESLRQQKQLTRMLAARREQQSQQQLTENLQAYYADYGDLNGPGEEGASVQKLRNGSRFMGDLHRALELQQQREQSAQQALDEERERWLQMFSRNNALERLVGEAEREEARQQQLREEMASDEQWVLGFSRKT